MAIFQYRDHQAEPALDAQLASLAQQTMSTRGLLTMLGDYWVDYYRDTPSLAQANSGFVAAAGRQLTRLLETIKSGNILDLPVEQGLSFDLLIFNKSDFTTVKDTNGETDYFFVPLDGCDIHSIEFLTVSLFESAVILERGLHFDMADNGIRFYVDIFNDPSISTYEYQMSDEAQQSVLLWGCSIALSSYYIYQRYGRFLYRKAVDSYQYKWTVTSLMRYYTGAKTPSNIRDILDILFGIPYARYDGEVVQEITWVNEDLTDWTEHDRHDEAPYVRIRTDRGLYYSYGLSTVKYKVGDTVKKNELFCSFCDVLDYINAPEWWKTSSMGFPDYLFADQETAEDMPDSTKYDIMDRILKYNTVYTQVNITFESYDLYMQILEDLYTIIRTGFPVYLNPYVEVIFRTLFLDDFKLTETAKDELYLKLALVFSDPFCPFLKYDGAICYDGKHQHTHWNHDGNRMLDILRLTMHLPNMVDRWRFNKIYNGRFLYSGEIDHSQYDQPGWERFFVNVGYRPQDLYDMQIRVDDSGHVFRLVRNFSDPFCPFLKYNGERYYDGRDTHSFWVHDDNRMLDRLYANVNLEGFRDRVLFEKLYNGRFDHTAIADYGPNDTFALDMFDATLRIAMQDKINEIVDRLWQNLNVGLNDRYEHETKDNLTKLDVGVHLQDGSDTAEDGSNTYAGQLTLNTEVSLRGTELGAHITFVRPFVDRYLKKFRYNGRRLYDGRDWYMPFVHEDGRLTDRIATLQASCRFASEFLEASEGIWQQLSVQLQDVVTSTDNLEARLKLSLQDNGREADDMLSANAAVRPFNDSIADTPCYLYYGGVAQYAGDCEHYTDESVMACDGLYITTNRHTSNRKRSRRRTTIFL